MENHLEEPLKTVVAFLEKQGYRYAVIGGIALANWGVVRTTQDVDIKVLVPNMDYSAVRAALKAAFPDEGRSAIPANPLIVSVKNQGVIIDFLLALPGYEELIIERAVQRDMYGWSVQICSVEDLIIQKVVAGRGKDWSDVESLLVEHWENLDKAYIHGWLIQFAEALEKGEILQEFDSLQEKVNRLFE